MFAINKMKLLVVVLLLTTLFEVNVNGAAVNKTNAVEVENRDAEIERSLIEAAEHKDVEKRNLNEKEENLRAVRFQQVLEEGAASSVADSYTFFYGIASALFMAGVVSYIIP